jgi:hypothetical protein
MATVEDWYNQELLPKYQMLTLLEDDADLHTSADNNDDEADSATKYRSI